MTRSSLLDAWRLHALRIQHKLAGSSVRSVDDRLSPEYARVMIDAVLNSALGFSREALQCLP
ncbi:hypothetical protein GQ600_17388 [Phytophthora cactorum]|nr:hypothetical protein GQ600_17388 [Phytophthora cactorum]